MSRDSAGLVRRPWIAEARYRTARYFKRPEKVMGLFLLAILVVVVVIPLIQLLIQASTFAPEDARLVPGAASGAWTLYHWQRVVASPLTGVLFLKPLLNTVLISLGVVLLALPIGSLMAWLVVRTDLPVKRVIANVLIIPYVMPSWVMALAWFTVFKNARIGGAPGLLQSLGVAVPNWIAYGYLPIVLALTIHYSPYAFILASGALTSIDSQLEDTAMMLGASRGKILGKITFPLILPALGSAFVLVFSKAMGTFGTPAILGLPVRYYTMSTRIYTMMRTRVPGTASVLVIFLVLISALAIYMNNRLLGIRKKFTTIGGKGTRIQRTNLGRARLPTAVAACVFLAATILFPLALLVLQSLTLHGDFNLRELTLHFWIGKGATGIADGLPGIFRNPEVMRATWNSIKLAVVSALLASGMGLFFGYAVVKARGSFLSRAVENLAFAPYIIPPIALGGIFLSMFSRSWGPLPSLYGTFALLVLITVVKRLPYTSRTGISAMLQIDPSLEEAAYLRGTSWVKRMARVIVPLGKSGVMAGFILSFVTSMRMLSLIVLVVTPGNNVLTALTFRYVEEGYSQFSNAIAILIIVITLAGYLVASMLGKSKLEHIGGSLNE